jgi:8-oxo-dGTP pyrophosphatase MutT (NUDIX family)
MSCNLLLLELEELCGGEGTSLCCMGQVIYIAAMPRPYVLPVSVKGIIFDGATVWLRQNERGEWELPGGKLDEGEQPTQTVERELHEELGFRSSARGLVGAEVYAGSGSMDESRGVLVLLYLCDLVAKVGEPERLGEAGIAEFAAFDLGEIGTLNMPTFYKQAIDHAWHVYSHSCE